MMDAAQADPLYRAIFDDSMDGVLLATADEAIFDANPAACKMLGLTREALLRCRLSDILDQNDPRLESALEDLRSAGRLRTELNFCRQDRQVFPAAVSCAIIPIGQSQLAPAMRPGKSWVISIIVRDLTERKRLLQELRRLATHDELTGLYNHREMVDILKDEIARSERYKHSASLIMLDVDHLNAVNDNLGHQAGDMLLRQVAELVRENIRKTDMPARFGGDDLAIILPETPDTGAMVVAERIRQAVAGRPFNLGQRERGLLPIRITVSLGIACYPTDGGSEEALVAAANHALHRAKQQGRNRVVRFGDDPLVAKRLP